jgi:hypothetical protein
MDDDEKIQVSSLVNTSVEDMASSLKCSPEQYSLDVLEAACKTVAKRGEKTKAVILKRMINKIIGGNNDSKQ